MGKRSKPRSEYEGSLEASQYGIPPSVRSAIRRAGEEQPLWHVGGAQRPWEEIEVEKLTEEDLAALEAQGLDIRELPLVVTNSGKHPGASLRDKS